MGVSYLCALIDVTFLLSVFIVNLLPYTFSLGLNTVPNCVCIKNLVILFYHVKFCVHLRSCDL